MLDIYYPTLRAFVRACREIQKWLDAGNRCADVPEYSVDYKARDLLSSGSMRVYPDGAVRASAYFD